MHAGAQEVIFDFMNVVLEKGDHVISMYPIYQSLYEIIISLGCEVGKWELRPTESGKWELNFDELEKQIRPNTKVIAINTPNNPTGYTLTEEEIQKLCSIAGLIGAGSQSRMQLRALCKVRKIKEVYLWSPSELEKEPFKKEMESELAISVLRCSSPQQAVENADVVITVTPSKSPISKIRVDSPSYSYCIRRCRHGRQAGTGSRDISKSKNCK